MLTAPDGHTCSALGALGLQTGPAAPAAPALPLLELQVAIPDAGDVTTDTASFTLDQPFGSGSTDRTLSL